MINDALIDANVIGLKLKDFEVFSNSIKIHKWKINEGDSITTS